MIHSAMDWSGSKRPLLLIFCIALRWASVEGQCSSFPLDGMITTSSYSCTASNYQYREGCTVTVQCKQNHYFLDKNAGRDGQLVKCEGGRWRYNGREPEYKCQCGCVGLRDDLEMKNATYFSDKPPNTYYNGDLVMWKKDTKVKTECKDGYIFRHKWNQEDGRDDYICVGGDTGWTDNKDPNEKTKTGFGKAPGLCNPLCKPMDIRDVPTGVKLAFNPLDNKNNYKEGANGVKMLLPSATYNFQCMDGFKYADGSTSQKLSCRGGGDGFEDLDDNKRNAKVKPCIANGCPPITSTNVDPSAQIERTGCKGGDAVNEGCVVTIKCKKPTHYFANPNLANGYTLKCNAKGEWVDQQGVPAKTSSSGSFTDACVGGCPVLSSADMANAEYSTPAPTGSSVVFNNGEQQIFGGGVRVTTKCRDGFARPNEKDRKSDPITFTCDPNSNAWTNTATGERGSPTTCQSGCKLAKPAEGTRHSNVPEGNIYMSGGQQYATFGSRLVVQCNTDYEDPKTKNPQSTQTIVCKGDNVGGWVEEATQTSAQPMTCVRSGAKGCDVASLNNANATKSGCDIQDGLMPENCKLTIKCKEGYIPSDPTAVDGNGEQSLVCVAKNDGWKDSKTGKTKVQPVKCVPVCTLMEPMNKATYVKKPADTDLVTANGKTYVKQGATVTITCKEPYVGKIEKDREGAPIEYLCRGGNDGWYKPATGEINRIPGDSCGALCDPLSQPAGTSQMANPQVFEYKGEPKVVEGGRYRFKCSNGFKYPDGTPEATDNQQILVCLGDNKGYVNEGKEGKDNLAVIPCVRGSTPGCPKLDPANPAMGINITTSNGCSLSNDKTSVGCTMSLQCANGYYPTSKTASNQPGQSIKCIDNGTASAWVDSNSNARVDMLECKAGCPSLGVSSNAVLITGAQPTIDSPAGKFFDVGTKITVQCAAGSVHRNGKIDNPSESMEYVCRGGSDTPWTNSKYPGFEKVPGDGCLRTCNAPTFPPGMRATESPATSTMGDKLVVKGHERYKLKCMDGYHYPAGSAYEKNNEQILICDNDSGKLKDITNGGQLVEAPTKCIKTSGDGCADLALKDSEVTRDSCSDGKKKTADCEITIQCKNGFIPSDPIYHKTGKQTLKCKDGYDWIDSTNGTVVTTALQCKAACKVDSSSTNPSAEITKKSDKTITVDKVTYVDAGEVVTVTCKGDEVLWEVDSSKTPKPHEYFCAGGNLGWKRDEDSKLVLTLGEGCVKTCPPLALDSLPPTVRLYTSPKVIEYNGKQYVAEGQTYSYKCSSDKYQYPSNSPNGGPQQETAKCDGSKRSYVNANGGKAFAKPESCTRKENQDECLKIAQNTSVTIAVTGSKCNGDGDYVPTGCEIAIKCKQGYYPSDKTYLNPTGEQKISCLAGGKGWSDQANKKIAKALNCVKGCVKPSASTSNSESVIEKFSFVSSSGVTSKCESKNTSTTVVGVLPDHPYYCPVEKNDTSYYDKECTNACRELSRPLPLGVTVFKAPEMLTDKPYAFAKEQYVLKCAAGYVYPKGSKQRDQGRQTLVCDGATNKYNDVDDGKKGVSPMACEEAKGCAEIKQPNEAEVTKSGCSFNDPYYNDKCELTVNCKNGFYPKDLDAVTNQGEKIVCDEEKDTWVKVGGGPIKAPLECVAGCKEINLKEFIEWNNSTEKTTEITNYPLDGKFYKCIAATLLEKALGMIKKSLLEQNRYYCKRTELKVEDIVNLIQDDTVCKDTCPLKTFTPLPTGVVLKTTPNSFVHDNIKMIAKGASFSFECQEGYQYNPKSPYASAKKQEITCAGNSSYFDPVTNALNPKVQPCEKIIGCTPPVPAEGTQVMQDPSCVVSANIAIPPCKYTVECAEGYYPLNEDYHRKPNQSIVCTPGVAAGTWNDATTKKTTTPLKCTKGCIPKPKMGSDTSTSKDTIIEKYQMPSAGTAVCVSTMYNTSTVDNYKDINLPFYCKVNESSSMTNFTNTPCTNVCSNLTFAATLIVKEPATYIAEKYVPNTFTWLVKCPEGQVFADTNSRAREFQCDGATKTYTDLSTGKTMIIDVKDNCIAPTTTTSTTTTTTTTTTTKPPTTTSTTTTTTKPPTTTTATTTTTTTTTKPPTTTTPAPCASPVSAGVELKKGAAGPVLNGNTVEIACKPGQSPTDPSFYQKPSQTLKCSGGKLVDTSDPGNSSPKVLTCEDGCVPRKYNVTQTDSATSSSKHNLNVNGVIVNCSSTKLESSGTRTLIGEEHKFLCDDGLESQWKFENGTVSPCTNACMAPYPGNVGVPTSIKVTNDDSIMAMAVSYMDGGKGLVIDGKKYTLSRDKKTITIECAKSGEKFTNNPSSSSMKLICNAATGQYTEESTGKEAYPTKPLPPCGSPENPPPLTGCPSIASSSTLIVRKKDCGNSIDQEQAGCKVFLYCVTGEKFQSSWECQASKQWKSIKDGSSVATLPAPSC